MSKATLVSLFVFVILTILHQDSWNWSDRSLLFGFLPVGLGYHALYSAVVAGFWFLVSHFAWPVHIERWAEEGSTREGE